MLLKEVNLLRALVASAEARRPNGEILMEVTLFNLNFGFRPFDECFWAIHAGLQFPAGFWLAAEPEPNVRVDFVGQASDHGDQIVSFLDLPVIFNGALLRALHFCQSPRQCASHPPLMESGAPVIVRAWSEQRNAARGPTCSGVVMAG
jgi:hypothetical protein